MLEPKKFLLLPKVVFVLALLLSFLQLWWVIVHPLTSYLQQGIHLSIMLAIIFLTKPARKKFGRGMGDKMISLILAGCALSIGFYQCVFWQQMLSRTGQPLVWDILLGTILLILIMEGIRRAAGNLMCSISGFFLLYAFWKVNADAGFHDFWDCLAKIISLEFLSTQGIYNMPLQTMSSYIIVFVIFSAILNNLGANRLFHRLAQCLVGHKRGGTGKVSVVASCIMGTTSGSPIANLFTTGVYTIPMMRAQGYSSRFAGAIECASSIGGQLMPPIMGTVAFMIAEAVHISYQQVLLAALLPALLYYLSLFIAIDLETQKIGLDVHEKKDKKLLLPILKKDGVLLLPLLVLIILLAYYPEPGIAGGISILFLLGLGILRQPAEDTLREKVIDFSKKFMQIVSDSIVNICGLAALAAGSGMVIGFMELSGLGVTLTRCLVELANGSMFLTLLLWGILSLALGGPMPTLSAYLIVAPLAVPIFAEFGIAPVATHLFVLYFTMIGPVIPPVSILACCGASIAGGPPIQISLTTLKIASAAFVIPFVFAYRPELILSGNWLQISFVLFMTVVGIWFFVSMMEGFSRKHLSWGQRLCMGGIAFCCFLPCWQINVVSGFVAVIVWYLQYKQSMQPNQL